MIKVLIVDDDKLARRGLISLMPWEKFGMQVVGDTQNGKLALEFVKEESVDLVFVDIDMPEINGLEFMEQCHQMDSDIQFVVLSSYERFDYVQFTLRVGGLDYLSKTSMDFENCDEVLKRIRIKYDEKRSKLERISVSGINEEVMDEIRKLWRSKHWIFDDCFWGKLKERMLDASMDVRRVELLVSNCVGELESLTGMEEMRLPLFNDIKELIQWVSRYRDQLYENAKTLPQASDFGRMVNTVIYMKENVSKDISTTMAASRIGASRSYFCTVFKKWVGISFGDYLQQLRIEYAKELLSKTNTSIAEIAFLSGYNDVYYFSRVFRKATGCPPAEYRKLKNI